MAKYARGKKSQAISDRSGLRVPYTQLKTTWDGLRVSPEDWEPKQPQLTPAKNVVDATALFNPRPDNDPENVEIFIGFNYDPFIDPRQRPGIGVHGKGGVGKVSRFDVENTSVTGASGTGAVGTISLLITTEINVTGSSGSGEVGDETPETNKIATGLGGTGGVGTITEEVTKIATGVAGDGDVGAETVQLEKVETGVGGTGGVGSESIDILGWGNAGWGEDGWGE
jgi:hypothetical protein